jgi:hypothetical protein
LVVKTRTPPPVWQWGSGNFRTQSEPDRHATQQQRVQQKAQIQIAIHSDNITIVAGSVKWFLIGGVLVLVLL